ncbi:MAG: hypothetical protein K0S07_19 [Chlamydiales bacterium]|jgi:hypothetical protein|nr:hypothetical protein [Chlamydiales bacterium]
MNISEDRTFVLCANLWGAILLARSLKPAAKGISLQVSKVAQRIFHTLKNVFNWHDSRFTPENRQKYFTNCQTILKLRSIAAFREARRKFFFGSLLVIPLIGNVAAAFLSKNAECNKAFA